MIAFKNIDLRFGEKIVLSNFNAEIGEGEKVLIKGRSGIGKSSLFQLLLGSVYPQSGRVCFNGKTLNAKNIWQFRQTASYVPQNLDLGSGKVEYLLKQLLLFKANRHIKWDESLLKKWLEEMHLPASVLNEEFETLSGGEKQRIAITAALMLGRKLFLLDEATSALDLGLKNKIINRFLEEPEWTVMIISHDPLWQHYSELKKIDLEA